MCIISLYKSNQKSIHHEQSNYYYRQISIRFNILKQIELDKYKMNSSWKNVYEIMFNITLKRLRNSYALITSLKSKAKMYIEIYGNQSF